MEKVYKERSLKKRKRYNPRVKGLGMSEGTFCPFKKEERK